MADAGDILEVMKKSALEAVEAAQPSKFVFGKVLQIKPLKIQVADRLILTKEFLTLTRNVTTYNTYIKAGSGKYTLYSINNELQVGDKVVLLKNAGATGYLVIDRVVKAK